VFELSNAPDSEGLRWVQAVPKARDGALQSVRLGFRAGQLAVLEMLDSFGQRSVLAFGPVDTQPGFRPDHFRFTPPAGTEVLRP
jgi:outer membrane lipoprotein carrier protein